MFIEPIQPMNRAPEERNDYRKPNQPNNRGPGSSVGILFVMRPKAPGNPLHLAALFGLGARVQTSFEPGHFALQLAMAFQSRRSQQPALNGLANRTTRFGLVLAIGETAVAGERLNILEGLAQSLAPFP